MSVNEALLRYLHPREVPCRDCEEDNLCMECREEVDRDRIDDEREAAR